jgi:hypothetical protein
MTKKDLLSVASKVLGLYLIVVSIDSVIMSISAGVSNFDYYILRQGALRALFEFLRFFIGFVPLSLYFIVAFVLIIKSDMIAGKLCRDNTGDELEINLEKKDLIDFAFILVGIGSIGHSLLNLVRFISVYANRLYYGAEFSKRLWTSFFEFLALFLFGVFLVLGSKRLTDFVENIRK